MKKLIIITSALLLAGCTTVPLERTFPARPEELKERCPDLKQTQETDQLSTVLDVVADNYGLYHKCQNRNDKWNEWYEQQKKIFESVK